MTNRWGNNGNSDRLYFLGFQNHCILWLQPWNWKTFAPWKKSYDQPRQHIKKQRHYFANKGSSSQSYGFLLFMYGCESWTIKKAESVRSLGCARLFEIPWMATHQAPLSMGFSRQGYWSGLPFPSPGDLPNPRIEPRSPALQADPLPTEIQGKP